MEGGNIGFVGTSQSHVDSTGRFIEDYLGDHSTSIDEFASVSHFLMRPAVLSEYFNQVIICQFLNEVGNRQIMIENFLFLDVVGFGNNHFVLVKR